MTKTAAELDIWHTSKSGRIKIRLYLDRFGRFEVYALDGHELLPRTRHFDNLDAARTYANSLWGSL